MYSPLPVQMMQTQQDEIAAHASQHQHVRDLRAASHRGPIRRGAGKAIVALGVCAAVATVMAVSDASARQAAPQQRVHVSARQLQREINALNSVGFVATSCEVGGTRMKNYSTNQSVLLPL